MNILEAFEVFKDAVIVLWKDIKIVFQTTIESKKKIAENDYIRSTWIIELDTRQPSQVINRKPLFAIQKII